MIEEYSGAAGVPMAVPEFCCQWVSPKVNMLLAMNSFTDVTNSYFGKEGGIFSLPK